LLLLLVRFILFNILWPVHPNGTFIQELTSLAHQSQSEKLLRQIADIILGAINALFMGPDPTCNSFFPNLVYGHSHAGQRPFKVKDSFAFPENNLIVIRIHQQNITRQNLKLLPHLYWQGNLSFGENFYSHHTIFLQLDIFLQ